MSIAIRFLLVFSILSPYLSSTAYGTEARTKFAYDNEPSVSFGPPAPDKPLSNEKIRLFVWNIKKGEDARMTQDFSYLAAGADLVLFQEAVNAESFVNDLTNVNTELEWTMAKAFQMLDFYYTGVATGYRVRPVTQEVIVSKATEPVLGTPKTILVSSFQLENSTETLLVANIHGINFVGLDLFKSQIRQMYEKISHHQGPMVVAGDFNTWDPARFEFLEQTFGPMNLKWVPMPSAKLLTLDHIFVRGLTAKMVFDLSHIDSSDHAPMMVDLAIDPKKNAKN